MVAGHCGSRPQPTHGLARTGSSPCTGAGDRGGGYGPPLLGAVPAVHVPAQAPAIVGAGTGCGPLRTRRSPPSPTKSGPFRLRQLRGAAARPSRGRIVAEAIRRLGRPILDKPGPFPPPASRRQSAPRACIGSRAAGLDQLLLHGPPDDLLQAQETPLLAECLVCVQAFCGRRISKVQGFLEALVAVAYGDLGDVGRLRNVALRLVLGVLYAREVQGRRGQAHWILAGGHLALLGLL